MLVCLNKNNAKMKGITNERIVNISVSVSRIISKEIKKCHTRTLNNCGLSKIAHNVPGLPQYGQTLNWAAVNWLTFFFQANLRQTGDINKSTMPRSPYCGKPMLCAVLVVLVALPMPILLLHLNNERGRDLNLTI